MKAFISFLKSSIDNNEILNKENCQKYNNALSDVKEMNEIYKDKYDNEELCSLTDRFLTIAEKLKDDVENNKVDLKYIKICLANEIESMRVNIIDSINEKFKKDILNLEECEKFCEKIKDAIEKFGEDEKLNKTLKVMEDFKNRIEAKEDGEYDNEDEGEDSYDEDSKDEDEFDGNKDDNEENKDEGRKTEK